MVAQRVLAISAAASGCGLYLPISAKCIYNKYSRPAPHGDLMLFARHGGLVAASLLFASTAIFLTEANADPVCGKADLSKLQSRIYVAPGGSDGPACGTTTAAACATIQYGIGRCAASGCGVLVHHGLYKTAATIALRDSVNVYGGCVFDNTTNPGYRTVVQAAPASGTPAVSATSINAATTVYGLVVIGKNETQSGTASVTMAVSNSSGLALDTVVLASGQGGPGAAGTPATAVGTGGSGTSAFANSWGWPGIGGPSCASAHTTDAGNGGLAGTVQAFYGMECGAWGAPAGNASGSVVGGGGGSAGSPGNYCWPRPAYAPGNGVNGGPGASGTAGTQATDSPLTAGTMAQTVWQPSIGQGGVAGAVGSGGGGGGSGGSCKYGVAADGIYGFAAGAGGGGGCGGAPGTGGQQGGASLALILSGSNVNFAAVSIIPGTGGSGGIGGSAVSGGAGGAGGTGIHSGQVLYAFAYCPGLSGDGGPGGPGGAGSGGAGGNGGPAIGIALAQNSTAPPSTVAIYPGLPGVGGGGGGGGPAVTLNGITVPAGPNGQAGLTGAAAASVNF
jgi:hypothetical protein